MSEEVHSSSTPIVGQPNPVTRMADSNANARGDESNVETAAPNQSQEVENPNPYAPKKRQKKSAAWTDFKEVLVGTTKKFQCVHCKVHYLPHGSGVTTTLLRHGKQCLKKPGNIIPHGQQQLTLEATLELGESVSAVQNFKYDQAKLRESMVHCFIVHEMPFMTAEYEMFNAMMRRATPLYQKVSRTSIQADVFTTYDIHRKKIKQLLENVTRMSLTTDLWRSNQTVEYMVVTCHFVDKDWKLQKRVLNFCEVPPPHNGLSIYDALHTCLSDWDIEKKIWTITLDNASYNDVAVRTLKGTLSYQGELPLGGEMFHVRCCAHIINILVQCGLKEIEGTIKSVRESIRHIAPSTSRVTIFRDIAKQLKLPSKKLILDCCTRWNSTYHMISTASEMKAVFPRYAERDSLYKWLPADEDWVNVLDVCEFLELFNDITTLISGSSYSTVNLFLPEMWAIKMLLKETLDSEKPSMRSMASKMLQKFEKYWGQSNLVISIACVLDPRNKFKMLELYFPDLYDKEGADYLAHIATVRDKLHKLFDEYVEEYKAKNVGKSSENEGGVTSSAANITTGKGKRKMGRERFDSIVQNVECVSTMRSELDVYLQDCLHIHKGGAEFNVIEWWKEQSMRYKILSTMACDIMAIPITSVASEAAFSAGGRVVDKHRTSLGTKTVQALLCTQDWLKNHYHLKKTVKTMTKKEDAVEIDLS